MSNLQFVIPLNSTEKSPTLQLFFRACDIWLQTAFASKLYVIHGKSFSHIRTIFVLMKIEMCSFQNLESGSFSRLIWPLFCNSDAFNDRTAVSITRAITRGDRRFAFEDGRQAFFDSIASWGCDLRSHVSPIKQNQYGGQETQTCVPNRELLSK